jgi:uncharacterized protein (DUF1015 family)
LPFVRPFRALRYAPDLVPDLAAVVAPPYDVIEPDEHRALLARDPRNVVRLDLPAEEAGDEPDERYRRAARQLSAWRSDGTLHRDPRLAIYPYEQVYRVPGTDEERVRRGIFARVRLEAFGPDSGIRPHERTLAEAREDRYRLLRATNVNTSPVVGLYEDPTGRVPEWLTQLDGPPIAELTTPDGIRHRLWMTTDEDGLLAELCGRMGAGPITLADGHHRYETALRYRDERMTGAAETEDPAWGDILMLLLEPVAGPLTVLPTHRVLLGLGDEGLGLLEERLPELFEVGERVSAETLVEGFGAWGAGPRGAGGGRSAGGAGRFGLLTRDGGTLLQARRSSFEQWLPAGGPAVRRLDVTLAGAAIEHLAGLDAAAVADGGRIAYTKDAAEALAWVDAGRDGADAALLLEPTTTAEIIAVAAEGDVMPQKSTFIYPKAFTGLVINPLE